MFDKFSERHIGVSNEKDLKAMLEVIGAKSVDELISQVIPQSIRLKKPLALPAEGMSEYEFAAHIRSLADRNRCLRSFIRPHDQQTVSLHGRDWSVQNETHCDRPQNDHPCGGV